MVYDTHSLEAIISITYNYKTSRAAHQRLEKIIFKEYERAMKIDYGLQMLPETILHVANAEEFKWLLQPELKAIKDGLTFGEKKYSSGNTYTGYLNADGLKEGPGLYITLAG